MASTQKKNNTLKLISKYQLFKFRKKCSDVMKNFNISKSTLHNIKNLKFTLIDTDLAKNINLIYVGTID